MKITIYELLGLIKDGKAPKKIRYRYGYLYKNFEFDGETSNYISDKDWLFGEDITAMLNDEVEIIEEDIIMPCKYKGCGNEKYFRYIADKINELIDEINKLKGKDEYR